MPNDVRRILSLFAIELQEGPDHSDIFCRFPDHPIAALLAVLMPHKAITVVVHCGHSLSLHCCVLHSICLVHLGTPAVSEICSILTYLTVIKTSILSYASALLIYLSDSPPLLSTCFMGASHAPIGSEILGADDGDFPGVDPSCALFQPWPPIISGCPPS